ncbi:MAG: hypothetical protein ABH828_04390 [archaeon]
MGGIIRIDGFKIVKNTHFDKNATLIDFYSKQSSILDKLFYNVLKEELLESITYAAESAIAKPETNLDVLKSLVPHEFLISAYVESACQKASDIKKDLFENNFSEKKINCFEANITECLNNVVEHANGGDIDAQANLLFTRILTSTQRICWAAIGNQSKIDWDYKELINVDESVEPAQSLTRGRGLYYIKKNSDFVAFDKAPGIQNLYFGQVEKL